MRKALVAFVFALTCIAAAHAAEIENGRLSDPALEQRAQQIGAQLRCVACQNQSIEDSSAPLAGDMRLMVRERLLTGEQDAAIVDYVADRYGDFVLLDPPFKLQTLLLWLGPLLFIGLAALAWAAFARSAPVHAAGDDLTDAERARLAALLRSPKERL